MKRFVLSVVVVCMLVTLFSGCGKSEQTESLQTTGQNEGQQASIEDSGVTEAVEKSGTIKWFHHFGEEGKRKWIESSTNKFTENNEGIIFEVLATSFDNYVSTLKTKIAAGDPPDIYSLDDKNLIKEFVDAGYSTDLTGQPFLQNVQQAAIDGASMDNKVYALGLDTSAYVITYNKDVFKKAGIDPIPQTQSEFIAACKTLESAGVTPIAAGYQEWWVLSCDTYLDNAQVQFQLNPKWREDLQSRRTTFAGDKAGFRDTLLRLADRYKYVNNDPFSTDWNKACQLLATGKAGMILNGSWTVDAVKSINPDVNVGLFAFPWSENPDDTKVPVDAQGGLAIFKGSPMEEAALKFFDYITQEDVASEYQNLAKAISTVKGLTIDFEPAFNDLLQYQEKGKTLSISNFRGDFDEQYNKIYFDTITLYLLDENRDVDKYLKMLDDKFDELAKTEK